MLWGMLTTVSVCSLSISGCSACNIIKSKYIFRKDYLITEKEMASQFVDFFDISTIGQLENHKAGLLV